MTVFLLDLWHDLRAKRLWPVALVLLAGLVAVPVLLAKPSPDESASSAPVSSPSTGPSKPAVALATEATDKSSRLNVFGPKDPFRPRLKHAKAGAGAASGSATLSTVGSLLTGLGNASGLSSGSGSGSSTGGTTSGGAAPLTAPTGGGKQTTVKYTYVIDVTWIHGHATRHIDGMKRLSMLPSETSPLLIFLGVDNGAGNAVFLVDATAKTSGEGRCKPSTSQCALLYLGPGSEQTITDEHGRRYTLRLEQIRRVRVGASAARASRRAGAARAGRARAARAARPASVVHEFAPLLTDLVIVASKAGDRSNSHDDRR